MTAAIPLQGQIREHDLVIARRIKHDLGKLALNHRDDELGALIRPVCGLAAVIERGLNPQRRAA